MYIYIFLYKTLYNAVTVGTPFDPLCADNLTCNSQRVDTTRGEILSISEIIIHENYKFTNQGIDKDVCLLKIPSLKCRPHTKIEILSKKPAADEKCDVLGWGTTKKGFQSTKIRSAQVLVSPVDKKNNAKLRCLFSKIQRVKPEQVFVGELLGLIKMWTKMTDFVLEVLMGKTLVEATGMI